MKSSCEALVQKAGILTREMDAKYEKYVALGKNMLDYKEECSRLHSGCVAQVLQVRGQRSLTEACEERARRRLRRKFWLDLVVCVLLVVDLVVRWVEFFGTV